MQQPRFTFIKPGERRWDYGTLPVIDKTRATANLVRQSINGADIEYVESREHQLGLQVYSALLYGDVKPNVRLYDEGAGVSGQKRIDQRGELDRLYRDIAAGIVGTIVLAREDRLFRNKHFDQVGPFTKLCEKMRVKLIVPSPSDDSQTRVYDFTRYQDLLAFQEKMKESYGYIEGHIKYMHQCQVNKALDGGYDGRGLPPGLAVKGKKQEQVIIVYEPWAEEMRKLALLAQALDWNIGKLNREVANMDRLFPEIPPEDRERYIFNTTLQHIPEVGYRPRDPNTIRVWLTNVMYIGWWKPLENEPDTIPDHHEPIIDYKLFAEGYARLKGYTLDGEPVENYRGVTRIRKTREEPIDALFHGRLIATPPSPDRTAFTTINCCNYRGYSPQGNGLLRDDLFNISVLHFDAIIIERLKELELADPHIRDKVVTTLEKVADQQSKDFVSIHDQLEGLEKQLKANARKLADDNDEDLEKELRGKRKALLATKEALERKSKQLRLIGRDSPEEIKRLHELLGNFDDVWPTWDLEQKQRASSMLINRIEVEVVSPHWLCLLVDWQNAICPRVDYAYVWKATPSRGLSLSDHEIEIIREHYPRSPRLDIMRLLPDRTWNTIQTYASIKHVKREIPSSNDIPLYACYYDFMPKLDGTYIFGNYKKTLDAIKHACTNTHRFDRPLCSIWLLPENIKELADGFVQCDLGNLASPGL